MAKTESPSSGTLFESYSRAAADCSVITSDLYTKYEVKRGLRDISGKGVLAGLTEISEIVGYIMQDDDLVPCEGKLYYRGIDIESIVAGLEKSNYFGFEEICFLLLVGHLPDRAEYDTFRELLASYRSLPAQFLRDTIMTSPSRDMMNSIASSVLSLYAYDDQADDTSLPNVMRQSIQLLGQFPTLMVHSFHSYAYNYYNKSLVIHSPVPEYSTAQNILHMLRPDSSFTELESHILDQALILHAEHGGGNNSTFTTHVVTSSGTDTYSSIAASLCSLKGPKHGGASIKVIQMFDDMKKNVSDWTDDDEIRNYVLRLLNKDAFDRSGLIYGIGHAVYSLSDPRAVILKKSAGKLASEKNADREFGLYEKVERIAPEVIREHRQMYKGVSVNVDFFSGFVYRLLCLPEELYTPLFASARLAGWSAHRIEELSNGGKIIRPAYKSVSGQHDYIPMENR
ncbi:MAG TPA: citrate synthase [Treponema sp.]|mgnify:CR=1 FL=1|nr:citrate synthase [Treponema sp.]